MADWPLTSDLGPLGALPTAPRLARGFIGVVLTAWGLTALADVTELLVSELTANVVRASTGPDGNPRYDNEGKLPLLWVRLLSDHFRIMIEVWDNLPPALGTPVVRHPGPDEESGRGLEMIDALSEDWGWESVPGWKGKRVWAVLLAPLSQPLHPQLHPAGQLHDDPCPHEHSRIAVTSLLVSVPQVSVPQVSVLLVSVR